MARVRLKHVTADRDRHDNVRYYFRKRGLKTKTRLPGLPGSAEFMAAYEALLAGRAIPPAQLGKPLAIRADANSLRWLCQHYIASAEFKGKDSKTQRSRAHIFAAICDEPISDSNPMKFGEGPFAEMTSKALRRLLDRKSHVPGSLNNWLQAIKVLFKWGVTQEYCTHNPAKEIAKIRTGSDGYHSWMPAEVAQFEALYPIGSAPRLALALLLYTGQRRSDVILFGPQHVKDGWLRFTQQKNKNRRPVTLEVPVLPALAEVIELTRTGHLVFLLNSRDKAFSHSTFGNRFRQWCNAAGLPHCTAHGLRKAGASRAAENGATAPQLMAIFGWRDIKQAEFYIRSAEQKRLAGASMHLIRNSDKK